MLAKLLRHDLKTIYKPLIIFYSITLLCAILAYIFQRVQHNNLTFFLGEFFKGATGGFLIGAVINNSMNIWQYFRSQFYGDRSYLMHTLPVTRATLLLSQTYTILITIFTTLLVGAISLLITYSNAGLWQFVHDFITTNGLGTVILHYILPFVLTIYLEFLFIVQCGITGIVIGHRAVNNRIPISVAVGFVVFAISNIITVLFAMLLACFDSNFYNALFSGNVPSPDTIMSFLYAGSAVYLLYLGGTYFLNFKLLQRGIDVD